MTYKLGFYLVLLISFHPPALTCVMAPPKANMASGDSDNPMDSTILVSVGGVLFVFGTSPGMFMEKYTWMRKSNLGVEKSWTLKF